MAGSSKKLTMATDEVDEKENMIGYPSSKSPITYEINKGDPFLYEINKRDLFLRSNLFEYREDRLGNLSNVKGPIIQKLITLPKYATQQNQQARLFTKEAGSTEGLIQSIGSPRHTLTVPLLPLYDYTVLHTRKDGWVVFFREVDLSIVVFNVVDPKPEHILPTPPIPDITEAKILSASLIGGTSLGSLELFVIGAGIVEDQDCGILLHLGRNESIWSMTRFPAFVPTKAVGPLLLEGGVLMSILNGSIIFTHDLHDLSIGSTVVDGFRITGDSTLVKGTRGNVYAVQVPDLPDAAPMAIEVGVGQGWLIPTITPLGEATAGRFYLTKGDVGFTLPGGSVYFSNLMGDQHFCSFTNGVWEQGFDVHPGCTCSGGFLE